MSQIYQFVVIKIDCIIRYNDQCSNSKIIPLQHIPFLFYNASQSAAYFIVASQKQLQKRSNPNFEQIKINHFMVVSSTCLRIGRNPTSSSLMDNIYHFRNIGTYILYTRRSSTHEFQDI